jgi:hypothetical protein
MTEQVQAEAQAESQSIDEAAVSDLGQHGHAAAQLEDPDHVNPHEAGHDEPSDDEAPREPSEEAIMAENEALGHDTTEQFQQ